MKLKANLHFHSKEDPLDFIEYNLFDGIDKAIELGFKVLATTCHTKVVATNHHKKYAAEKGILLIQGIEANIHEKWKRKRSHVVILNCDERAANIHTFEELKCYKQEHPEIFVIAPHPYFFAHVSLNRLLEKHIDLFDAIELSWFYTLWYNPNTRAAKTAKKFNKPFIATSDTHFLEFMNTSFVTVDSEKTPAAFFKAIKNFNYINTTAPRTLFEILFIFGYRMLKTSFKKTKQRFAEHFTKEKKYITSYHE